MPSLPKKKVGLIACGGEELAEGTLSRVAIRLVLEKYRPDDTVTLCLPLFLAGRKKNEPSPDSIRPLRWTAAARIVRGERRKSSALRSRVRCG